MSFLSQPSGAKDQLAAALRDTYADMKVDVTDAVAVEAIIATSRILLQSINDKELSLAVHYGLKEMLGGKR